MLSGDFWIRAAVIQALNSGNGSDYAYPWHHTAGGMPSSQAAECAVVRDTDDCTSRKEGNLLFSFYDFEQARHFTRPTNYLKEYY